MKKIWVWTMAVLVSGVLATLAGAEGTSPAAQAPKATGKKASNEVWICPMGDYSGPKTKDGKCPKCGMDLVKKARAKKEKEKTKAHASAVKGAMKAEAPKAAASEAKKVVWTCPMCGGAFDKPGHCPECGMDLVKKN